MNLSLAVAILNENLKGPTAAFDEMGLNAVRWAWETVKTHLPAECSASVAASERRGEACADRSVHDDLTNSEPSS